MWSGYEAGMWSGYVKRVCEAGILTGKHCCIPCELSSIDGVCHSHASWVHITFGFGLRAVYPCAYKVFGLAYAASVCVCPKFPIEALQFKLLIVPWLEIDVSASFLASDVLFFWFQVLGANMVGDVVCVLSCGVLIFFPNCFWDTPLQCL